MIYTDFFLKSNLNGVFDQILCCDFFSFTFTRHVQKYLRRLKGLCQFMLKLSPWIDSVNSHDRYSYCTICPNILNLYLNFLNTEEQYCLNKILR